MNPATTRPGHSANGHARTTNVSAPTVRRAVLNRPYHQPMYPHLCLGGVEVEYPCGKVEVLALLHTRGIDRLPPHTVVDLRINSECLTGDIFNDGACDCTYQLFRAAQMINDWQGEGPPVEMGEVAVRPGLIVYPFGHEGRGEGWVTKLEAYEPETGMFNVKGDSRDFSSAVVSLKHFGISAVRLITNNPHKEGVVSEAGIRVTEVIPVVSDDPRHAVLLDHKRRVYGHRIPVCIRPPEGV